MKQCELCGSVENAVFKRRRFGKYLCQKCYKYEMEHPVNPIPKKGEVQYDNEGRPICHICGRAFKKLASHAFHTHNINAYEYKEKFGLNNNQGLISESTKKILQEHSKNNYDLVIKENLLNKGKDHRFKKGGKGRTRDMVRLQCRNVLIQNTFKNVK